MENQNLLIFAERLKKLIKESGKKITVIADEINISSGALSNYQNGKAEAGITALVKIADYFQVSTDYLLGKVKVPTTDVELQQFCDYSGLYEESVKTILKIKAHSSGMNSMFNQLLEHDGFMDFLSAILTHVWNTDYNHYKIDYEDAERIAKVFDCRKSEVKKYLEASSVSSIELTIMEIVKGLKYYKYS